MSTQNRPLTAGALIEILSAYPAETPLFHGKECDLFPSHVRETIYDDWEHSEKTDDGEIPARGVALAIGPRF